MRVVLVLLHSPRLQHPEEWTHRPFLFALISIQYPVTNIQLVPMSLLIGAFENKAGALESFVSLHGTLLLASVASMTLILERHVLRDGESPLTSVILSGCY